MNCPLAHDELELPTLHDELEFHGKSQTAVTPPTASLHGRRRSEMPLSCQALSMNYGSPRRPPCSPPAKTKLRLQNRILAAFPEQQGPSRRALQMATLGEMWDDARCAGVQQHMC